ncbi:flagellar motor protein MotB [Haloimpatiens massiliensis]|uniref:flagellar motor protein MotB n=1 Tax=Haloimpatiens massiliensis TaxID=1658110 RepID=UPI000C824A9E|nr:flagellar motor protein MotB [Haloimpatiens massiliensis]
MSRKKKNGGSGLTGEEWLTTYSDTITLLLTFFVLLYSMSTVDANKFRQIASSLQSVLSGTGSNSILDYQSSSGEVPIVGEPMVSDGQNESANKKSMYEEVSKYVKENKMKDKIEVLKDPKGVVLRLRENVLFDIGKGEVKENSSEVLNMISTILQKFPKSHVIVEGHTDNMPISNYRYPSNWELSTARAVNVLKYFVEVSKMDPDRFTAAGYGEYRPIVPNNNDGNRAKNRRVNIIIEDTTTTDSKKGEAK